MESKPNTKEARLFFSALHTMLHRLGYDKFEKDFSANELNAAVQEIHELFSSSLLVIEHINAIGFPLFDVLRADELALGLVCLEQLAALKKGKTRSETLASKFLECTFQVESSLNPYG